MARRPEESQPESDRFEDAAHPRETFALVGHADVERDLLAAYRADRLPQAIIIAGPHGIGKATLAWRLSRFLLAHPDPISVAVQNATDLAVDPNHPVARKLAAHAHGDLCLLRREWNEKSKRFFTEIRAEEVRSAVHLFHHAAGAGGYRICIVDCADDFNRHSGNALLKLIEEPPPRSLFLIVANKPGLVLPTLRSRCRIVLLKPLSTEEIVAVIGNLGGSWTQAGPQACRAAAERAKGSVPAALRLLAGRGLEQEEQLLSLLQALPEIDWRGVHALADRLATRESEADFQLMMTSVIDWIDETLRTEAGRGAARLAALAQVWEKVGETARETEVLNLDKRALILSLFAELAAAARALAA
ncbi:MAG: DNA polymerase III subunit delta' [Beijerinckiaceae bacterium]